MMYMTSTATNTGTASITIYFKQGTDADMAVVNVQNRVASAQGLLPAEVTKSGVTVRKRQNSTLKSITPSVAVFGEQGDGYSSGDAIKAIHERIAPRRYRCKW